ncbi:hypothetical protein HDV00_004138 [Rhizophlyctis rosea]|nr:hypothetical protein HDV00_004138 [Rhizophlyctis rosea]
MSSVTGIAVGATIGAVVLGITIFTVVTILLRKQRHPSSNDPNRPLIPAYNQETQSSQPPLTPISDGSPRDSRDRSISVDLSGDPTSPLEPPPLERRVSISSTKKGHRVSFSRDLQQSVIAAQNEGSLPSYVVITDFEPRKKDELRLRVGEIVTVSMTFTDGFCHGYNTTTQKLGTFPLASVAVLKTGSPSTSMTTADQDLSSDSPTTPTNTSSPSLHITEYTMVAPEQALEVVTKYLTAERRAAYFESLLRTSSMDEGTREQFKRAAAGASLQEDVSGDVHQALLRHLEKGFKRWMDRVEDNRDPRDKLRRTKTSAGKPAGWKRPVPVRTQTL